MRVTDPKIKILLIQPITLFSSAFDFKNTIVTHLLEIATNVKLRFNGNSRVNVEVINLIDENIFRPDSIGQYDKHIKSLEQFLIKYNDGSALIFGISCFSSNYYISSLVLAKVIRKLFPTSLICAGGYQVNYFANEFLFPRTIENRKCNEKLFDFVFLGESDHKFAEFIEDRLRNRKTQSQLHEPCEIIQSGLIDNLESLPHIDYSLMKTPKSPFVFIPIYFSKGCPFNCTFCGDFRNIYKSKERWRVISPKGAFSRLKGLLKYYEDVTSQVQIFDPLWAYPDWRIDFYNLLQKDEISQELWAEIRIDQFSSKEIRHLKNLNFTLAFGMESASHNMLRIMKKTVDPQKYLSRFSSILTELDAAGIYVICNILFGHPGETDLSMTKTMEYVEKCTQTAENFIPSLSKYMLIPGSDVFKNHKYYTENYHSKFHYKHYWTIPKCSAITSSMVDPSDNLSYLDVVKSISQWAPEFYSTCIRNFKIKKDRHFIYQRYLNEMVLGPRLYWKNKILQDYNDFGEEKDIMDETEHFWNTIF
ncbi:MAG: B12-binding domain-containing radical SAM protein [Promethearchaeota archaeon]